VGTCFQRFVGIWALGITLLEAATAVYLDMRTYILQYIYDRFVDMWALVIEAAPGVYHNYIYIYCIYIYNIK
jgi:hypothetical protein